MSRALYLLSSFSGDTITNLPAAETEVTSYRFPAKLTGLTQARFSVVVTTAGFAGSVIYPKYSLNGGSTWAELDGATGLHASLTSTGVIVTGWVTLAGAAAADVLLGIFTDDGNGAVDPVVRGMGLDFRSTSLGRTIPWQDPNAADAYSNAPAAETLWPQTNRRQADLTDYTTARFSFTTGTPGSAGTTLMPKYSLNGGSTWAALDSGTGLRLPWDAAGRQTSAFVTIDAAARTDVLLGLFEAGGNATADPSAQSVILELMAPVSAPNITAVGDGSGCELDNVVITGTDFGTTQGGSTLTLTDFDSVVHNLTVVSWAATSITFTIPTGVALGASTITLTTEGGTDTFMFTIVDCPPPAVVVPRREAGIRLGCGDYQLFLQTQGGGQRLALIPFNDLTYGRRLDEISDARVVAGVDKTDCDPALRTIEPWTHELSIWRDSEEVWIGPIVRAIYRQNSLEISARDMFTWFERRFLPVDRDMTDDLSVIAGQFIRDAMDQDSTPGIIAVPQLCGVEGHRKVFAATYRRAADEIREMARTGLDFTAVGRTIYFGGEEIITDPLMTLTDSSFEVSELDIDGLSAATEVIVLGENGTTSSAPVTGRAGGVGIPGLLQQMYYEAAILDNSSAEDAAEGRLQLLSRPPLMPSGRLLEDAAILFQDLIPGASVDVAIEVGVRQVVDTFRLLAVNVSVAVTDSGTTESITVGLEPPGKRAT